MIEVTCFQCGQTVLISPDVTRCAACGANLRRLIDSENAINYFYGRASAFADDGNLVHAVQEVQRGITFYTCAELNLLGAILAKQLNRVDQMRQFVAAVPVDSPLRSEAEWLLRANQSQVHTPEAVPTDADLLPQRAERDRRQQAAPPARIQPVAWVMMLALLALAGWWGWNRLPPNWADSIEIAAPAEPRVVDAAPTATAPPLLVAAPRATEIPAQPLITPAPAPVAPAADDVAVPRLLPTPTIALDLVSAPTAAQPIAAVDPGVAAVAASAQAVDLAAWLNEQGRADLAALPVQARREGARLVLEGTVESVAQRTELEAYARLIPGITEISLLNVRVRLPATYTVQAGDSLWVVSVNLYGDPGMIEEIYAANRNVMSSPNTLSVGMVLAVPEKP
ncbi:MAG: LysM peptidoglycan-binding domain-containing protein [Caldilineaceae bacterium]|nr:LysM peptidoglycan-binding domain-containing protein [Caldilineaceae bacterium]